MTVDELKEVVSILKARTRKECMAFDLVSGIPGEKDSHVGGTPFTPVGFTIPTTKDGAKMSLLIQINLRDIDLDGWAKGGIVEVFSSGIDTFPDEYKVFYFTGNEESVPQFPCVNSPDFIFEHQYCLKFTKAYDYMPMSDYRFFSVLASILNEKCGTDLHDYNDVSDYLNKNFRGETYINSKGHNARKEWYDYFDMKSPHLTVGGYADFTQEDIREEDDDKTECLFKIDMCYDCKKIHLGDAGIAVGVLTKDNIKNCQFDQTECSWDCC